MITATMIRRNRIKYSNQNRILASKNWDLAILFQDDFDSQFYLDTYAQHVKQAVCWRRMAEKAPKGVNEGEWLEWVDSWLGLYQ